MAMANPENYWRTAFIVVPAVAFSLTFAVLLDQQHRVEGTERKAMDDNQPPVAATEFARPAEAVPQRTLTANGPLLPAAVGAPAVHASAMIQSPTADGALPEDSSQTLPVHISFRRPSGSQRQEALVSNQAAETLDVSLTVKNAATGKYAQVQFNIEPHAIKKFGLQGDLDIESGDQVSVQNPRYREAASVVP